MKAIIIYCILFWILLGVICWLIWHLNKNPELKFYNLLNKCIIYGIAFTSLIISLYSISYSIKIQKDQIIPMLQVKPIDIIDEGNLTRIRIDILNYSEYTAKNIFIDIKFSDKPWKRQLIIAEHRDSNKLIRFGIEDKDSREMLENFYNTPTWDELKPGKSFKLYMGDENKEFLSKQKIYFSNSDGTKIPIPLTETSSYRLSQGWQDELQKLDNGQQINVLFRVVHENEIGRKFDRIKEYKLSCTKIGTGRSYTFISSGLAIEDI